MEVTSKRSDIFDFIVSYIDKNGFPPTVQEIGAGTGLKSNSSVHFQLQTMADMGMIGLPFPHSARAIRVPGYHFVRDSKGGDNGGDQNDGGRNGSNSGA